MSWRPRTRTVRVLGDRQVRQILSRGGMLLHAGGVWTAYRSLDSRRMRIGVVEAPLAERLEAAGLARRMDAPPLRLCAGPWLRY
ncbi:MAG: hypothetical protein Q8L84_03235 [Hyphomonas sp.]|nr:hypothetical protein [Hyphomonas sp.]